MWHYLLSDEQIKELVLRSQARPIEYGDDAALDRAVHRIRLWLRRLDNSFVSDSVSNCPNCDHLSLFHHWKAGWPMGFKCELPNCKCEDSEERWITGRLAGESSLRWTEK